MHQIFDKIKAIRYNKQTIFMNIWFKIKLVESKFSVLVG
jgi:hypothetical protein